MTEPTDYERGQLDERVKVVKWLRHHAAEHRSIAQEAVLTAADRIERSDHLGPDRG